MAIKLQNADFDSSVMKWESMVMTDLSSISTIPKFKYYGHEHGRDYMVMELLTGEDMSSLRDRSRLSIPSRLLPMEVASLLTRQMLNCLQAMHEKGYVHRDVKPSNFVRRSKNTTEFCVIDFGLAKLVRTHFFVLTPHIQCIFVTVLHRLHSTAMPTERSEPSVKTWTFEALPSMHRHTCTAATTSAPETTCTAHCTCSWTSCWATCPGAHTHAIATKRRLQLLRRH